MCFDIVQLYRPTSASCPGVKVADLSPLSPTGITDLQSFESRLNLPVLPAPNSYV